VARFGAERRGDTAPAPAPAPAPARPAPASDASPGLMSTLGELRTELDGLREVVEREAAAREAAEARAAELEHELREQGTRSARVYEAITELRALLDAVRAGRGQSDATDATDAPAAADATAAADPTAATAATAVTGAAVEPADRLDAARTRLRETVPVPQVAEEAVEAGTLKPWLERAFKGLTAHDPDAAGRLLLALLPAQGLVHPQPIAYDLRLETDRYIHVTVAGNPPRTTVAPADRPRERCERQFWAEGDPAALARAVLAGGLRRRLGRGMARVEGSGSGFRALRDIIRAPRSLGQLYDAGFRPDPELAFTLAAWILEESSNPAGRLAIAHNDSRGSTTVYLHISHGARATVTRSPPLWDVTATIVCPGDQLVAVLAGRRGDELEVLGDEIALATLIGWLDHSQRR
jgi:hypothetical protein